MTPLQKIEALPLPQRHLFYPKLSTNLRNYYEQSYLPLVMSLYPSITHLTIDNCIGHNEDLLFHFLDSLPSSLISITFSNIDIQHHLWYAIGTKLRGSGVQCITIDSCPIYDLCISQLQVSGCLDQLIELSLIKASKLTDKALVTLLGTSIDVLRINRCHNFTAVPFVEMGLNSNNGQQQPSISKNQQQPSRNQPQSSVSKNRPHQHQQQQPHHHQGNMTSSYITSSIQHKPSYSPHYGATKIGNEGYGSTKMGNETSHPNLMDDRSFFSHSFDPLGNLGDDIFLGDDDSSLKYTQLDDTFHGIVSLQEGSSMGNEYPNSSNPSHGLHQKTRPQKSSPSNPSHPRTNPQKSSPRQKLFSMHTLELTNCQGLEYLCFASPQLRTLIINKTNVKSLILLLPQLRVLDISDNAALSRLTCYTPLVHSLIMRQNPALRSLSSNSITFSY